MFYIVALGNPGAEYALTRHNVGWILGDAIAAEFQFPKPVEKAAVSARVSSGFIAGESVTLLYPTTYMNNSGVAVQKALGRDEVSKLIVIHDDIALPLGELRISVERGAGGHNGIKSLVEKLGTEKFTRIRIGIAQKSFFTGKPKRPSGSALPRFVTSAFTKKELTVLAELTPQVTEAVALLIREGVEKAMNKYN